jgi:hypothetical protein
MSDTKCAWCATGYTLDAEGRHPLGPCPDPYCRGGGWSIPCPAYTAPTTARRPASEPPSTAFIADAARTLGRHVTHVVKVWPDYGDALDAGVKSFEYRKDDRGYAVGDDLHLREWVPHPDDEPWHQDNIAAKMERYTGREWLRRITYIARGGVIPTGYCVLAITPVGHLLAALRAEVERLRSVGQRVLGYASHAPGCNLSSPEGCRCGLWALRAALSPTSDEATDEH